ncbi:MAG: sigma-70 family RNA polymerase sigma factor [Planctomycetes bacterium]|nr:sigma-70 family RNA polymerase sigma factor [Planctomycetota bacterium]
MDNEITRVLDAIERGEPLASEQLLPLVYEELRRIASRKMADERDSHTLQPTALVHEAYLRLLGPDAEARSEPPIADGQPIAPAADGVGRRGPVWRSRAQFFAAAAEAMRRILIEAARRKATRKRGGKAVRVDLDDAMLAEHASPGEDPDRLLTLDEALGRLESSDPDSFQVVMLRYFAGMTVEETAEAMGISPRTVKRHWSFARAWLGREMGSD